MTEVLEQGKIKLTYINYRKPDSFLLQMGTPKIYTFRYQLEFASIEDYEQVCKIFKVDRLPVDSKGRIHVEYTDYWREKISDGIYWRSIAEWLAL